MVSAHELHNASYSYEEVPGGRDIVFNDPFTGQQLDPNKVPSSVTAQSHLHQGLNQLARFAYDRSYNVTIAGASHSQDSTFDISELGDLIADHDAVFLEGIGHTARHRQLIKEVGLGRTSIPDDFANEIGNYGVLQLAALSGHRKPIYYADTPGDGTPFELALTEWGSLARPLALAARETDGEDRTNLYRAAMINISGNTIMREWQMLGAIGNNLLDADRRGHDVGNSLFLIGTAHTLTLPRKLGLLGIASASVELTMHDQGASEMIEYSEFDFTTAVRDYRARLSLVTQ